MLMNSAAVKEKLQVFFSNRTNLILSLVLLVILGGLIFAGARIYGNRPAPPLEEVDLPFDPEGPYALLVPRRDGNAINLNIFRVSSYESITYELAYSSEGSTADEGIGTIDRGVQGTIDAKDKKSEYSQEVLFGTCSQGFTSGTSHCVFDKGVENGTLILKVKKPRENKLYRMSTTWHLQEPDVALGKITSGDGHFTYESKAEREELSTVGWSVINDLSGAPKLPEGKQFLGKVYAFNIPNAKVFPKGEAAIELAENPPAEAKIYRFVEKENNWQELDTKLEGSKLSASADGAGIFAILTNRSN
jgi:hypothetical protein